MLRHGLMRSRTVLLPSLFLIFVLACPLTFAPFGHRARQAVPTESRLVPKHYPAAKKGTLVSESRTILRSTASEGDAATNERSNLVQTWGVLGVVAYLSVGVGRVVPVVLEGIPSSLEEPWQWLLLIACLGFFAYVEGYRGFQLGFSPRVVSRAWVVAEDATDAP
eukprot:4279784-Amphidinium_carterae.2